MKKRALLTIVSVFTCVPLIVCAAVFALNSNHNNAGADPADEYSFTLSPTEFAASTLTTDYPGKTTKKFVNDDFVQQTFGEDKPVINYFLAKKDDSSNLVLAPGGRVYNYSTLDTYKGRITGISSVVAKYSGGALYIQAGEAGNGTVYGQKVALPNNTPVGFESIPNFVMISNSTAETTITEITFNYSCEEAGSIVGRLGETYTGGAADGLAYALLRTAGTNEVSVLKMSDSSVVASGTIALLNSNFTITLQGGAIVYTGTVDQNYKTLTITGKSGPYAANGPDFQKLNRVYVFDDFESYAQTGVNYSTNGSSFDKSKASDLRFQYYGDYQGGGYTTWITSSGFTIAQASDYVNLTTAVKHGGNKAMTVKNWVGNSSGSWTRYWSKETFDSYQHYNFGSGSRLSFWAHGAYSNVGCTAASTKDVTIRVQAYYQNFDITDSNRGSTTYGTGTSEFTIKHDDGWKQFSLALNPSKSVYAINIMVAGGGSNAWLPIDDIMIDTVPFYESPKAVSETATAITKTYNGEVSTMAGDLTVKVAFGANGYTYGWCGDSLQPTGYTINGNQLTMTTAGSYKTYTFGDWTGTFNADKSTLTINKSDITGTIANVITSSQIVLTEDQVALDGESAISSLFLKQNNNSGWVTEENGLQINDDYHIQGSHSIQFKPSNYNSRIIINPTVAEAMALEVKSIAFWIYIPAQYSSDVRVYAYNSYTPGTAEEDRITLDYKTYNGSVGQWKYFNLGISDDNAAYRKNIAIFVAKTSAPIVLDYITYF